MGMNYLWERKVGDVPIRREVFIETGSRTGDTLWLAKDLFPICHSIEIDPHAHAYCKYRFEPHPNVHVHLGDSREILPTIIDPTKGTTIFLDAHWEGNRPNEFGAECPLLGELEAIVAAPWVSRPVIIVDDWNMFYDSYWLDEANNHKLFDQKTWPRFRDISKVMRGYTFLDGRIKVEDSLMDRVGIWF